MENSIIPYRPYAYTITELLTCLQNYFSTQYKEAKQDVSQGVYFLKDGLSHAFGNTVSFTNYTKDPVNNFLKDAAQIEQEMAEDIIKHKEYYLCLNGQMVPASEILSWKMEENY